MSKTTDWMIVEQERGATGSELNHVGRSEIDSYHLHLARQALERIAAGDFDAREIARKVLVKIDC